MIVVLNPNIENEIREGYTSILADLLDEKHWQGHETLVSALEVYLRSRATSTPWFDCSATSLVT